ncbi:MAG: hypothetical protein U1E65_20965 [Myxococcota bacterium]
MRGLLVLIPLALASVASAQSAPGEARAAAPAAPDAVKLKNGGLLRGTISELIPGDTVVLITATGEVRRIPMADVEYAGPASGLASPAAPAAPSATARTIELSSKVPGITFHRRTSAAVSSGAAVAISSRGSVGIAPYSSSGATFAALCVAPCTMAFEPGTYYLGLSLEDGTPVSDNRPIVVDGNTHRIVADYRDRTPLRTAGFIVGGAGLIGAIATTAVVMAKGLPTCDTGPCRFDTVPLVAGVSISAGVMIIGYILGAQSDQVAFNVE